MKTDKITIFTEKKFKSWFCSFLPRSIECRAV